jgi:hypothetical protein
MNNFAVVVHHPNARPAVTGHEVCTGNRLVKAKSPCGQNYRITVNYGVSHADHLKHKEAWDCA